MFTAEFKRAQIDRILKGEVTAAELSRELGVARSLSPERIEALREASQKCDEHLRRAIRLILDDPALLDLFSKSSEAIDAYFLEQLFPGVPQQTSAGGITT